MNRARTYLAFGLGALALLMVGFWIASSRQQGGQADYESLVRAERWRFRFFVWWQRSPVYRTVVRVTGIDFEKHNRQKIEALEKTLEKSGYLVTVGILVPNDLAIRKTLAEIQRTNTTKNATPAFLRCQFRTDGSVWVDCRRQDLPFWQAASCHITNRVAYGDLRSFGGSREEIDFRLPDGRTVDLDACQRWLNESIAAGWMVGVSHVGKVLSAHRQKACP